MIKNSPFELKPDHLLRKVLRCFPLTSPGQDAYNW